MTDKQFQILDKEETVTQFVAFSILGRVTEQPQWLLTALAVLTFLAVVNSLFARWKS
jgi:hypothetical protein